MDAGINVGYALLDLDGNLVSSGVEKEASDETLVKIISGFGVPAIIASDVCPSSHFVNKVAARFNVKVHEPPKSLTKEEKRIIGKGMLDPHIRDAYAAAVKAYRRYANRLRQIETEGLPDKDRRKYLVIKGQPVNREH